MEQYKTCTKCGQTKNLVEFRKDNRLKSGYGSQCKPCKYAQTQDWVNRNHSRKLEINNKYRLANPNKVAEIKAQWTKANKDRIRENNKAYRERNKERLAAQAKNYRQKNKDAIREANKKWRMANPDRKKINDKRWWQNNPDKVKARGQKRRAAKKNASIYLVTDRDIQKIMAKPCLYCGKPSEHLDHVIPLNKGGNHSIGNLAPSCAKCNLSKGARLLSVWKYKTLAS